MRTCGARPHQKSVISTHPHAHFQSTFRTRVHKNRRTCARAGARTHTKGLILQNCFYRLSLTNHLMSNL